MELKRLPAAFYQSPSGNEPVRDWLLALDPKSRRIVGRDIATAEFGWPLGMPLCRHLGDRLWEVRSNLTGGRVARVIFVVHAARMVLLHGFVKKTQRTPKRDLELARQRAREITS
ncbi:MAG: type II toxin-antitoxin system RelE/ParE family toxin [Gemmatimonadota bacterium]|nr:type II toxin-antitoxin system RelE/ParE family toxin [Gemmatimonadota bacterium]